MLTLLKTELRYTDTFFQRLTLAFGSTFYGLASLNWLGLMFFVTGCAAWWRIFDRRPRVFIATVINLCVAALWVTLCARNLAVQGDPLADNVGEIVLCLTALFVVTRTDLTPTDKGTA